MNMKTTTHWNFECKNCPNYVKAKKPRHMGFCPLENRRVSKDYTCQKNPTHDAFMFHMLSGIKPELALDLAILGARS